MNLENNESLLLPGVEQISKMVTLAPKLWQEIFRRQLDGSLLPQEMESFELWQSLLVHVAHQNPEQLWRLQVDYATDAMKIWGNIWGRFWGETSEPVYASDPKDRRFRDETWQENFVFDWIRQTYLLTANWAEKVVENLEGVDEKTARRLAFYVRQSIDALSPANFAITNPEVMKATLDSHGENLVKGLNNMIADMQKSSSSFQISTADQGSFRLGENIATTEGVVVFRNHLFELLHYAPKTDKVRKTPLLIIPAWINKFYILDLSKENSFVRWLAEAGYNVFMISWVNPDAELRDVAFEDYLTEGLLKALEQVLHISGQEKANLLGYCLGGTLLTCALAYLAVKKQSHLVESASFLTTLIDFANPGDLGLFIDDAHVERVEAKMQSRGYMDGAEMSSVFSSLRANDMIWSYVVNNYLLGREPFPFDILYWNADSTRMPAKAHAFYLRQMYLNNALIVPNEIKLAGVPIDIRKIDVPCYFLSTREDHIAPWQSTYAALANLRTQFTFVLSGSGHVGGVVNPPARKKYGYLTNEKYYASAADWLACAEPCSGSWWEHWEGWLGLHSGAEIPVKRIEPTLGKAPGTYVFVR